MSPRTAAVLLLLLSFCLDASLGHRGKILLVPHPVFVSHMFNLFDLARDLLSRDYNVTVLRWTPYEDLESIPQ